MNSRSISDVWGMFVLGSGLRMVFPHFSGSNLAEVSLSELDTIPRTPPQSSQGMAPRRNAGCPIRVAFCSQHYEATGFNSGTS